MGHSVQQWKDWYDCKFHPRLGQNAVNAMQMWRNAMLQGSTASTSCQQAVDTEVDDVPQGKRRRLVKYICDDSESDTEAEAASQPADQDAAAEQLEHSVPVQQLEVVAAQEANGMQAEVEEVASDYLSCSSGSDDEIELVL
ncbi:MAG: hypothetical protein Q9179_007998 [Wetmoreana sp. 5 TL-2023]